MEGKYNTRSGRMSIYGISFEVSAEPMNERTAIDAGIDLYMDWEGGNEYERAGYCVEFPNGRRCWFEKEIFNGFFGEEVDDGNETDA